MAKLLKLRRGTTTQHASFTGAEGELTIDTTKDTAVVHDGTTQSGHTLLREDMSNLPAGTIDNADVNASAAISGTKISPDFGSQTITTTGKVLFANVYSNESDLPSAGTYHGMFAHVHSTGLAYFAHAGNWIKLAPLNAPDFTGGIDVSGNISVTGTVDGRDVAADGTKLDGIESGSTGDQTSTEIKSLLASDNLTSAHLAANSVGTSEIANNAVDFTKIQDVSAGRIIGRASGSSGGNPEQLTAAQVRTIINVEDGATADQSASEILAAIKTVDGGGSGLDADTVDGLQSSQFLRSDQAVTTGSHLTINGHLTVGQGTSSDIYFTDTDETTRRIHCNSNRIGFLKSNNDWGAYCDNSGNWTAAGNVTAYSDSRLKTDISTINNALGIVGKLRGVSYKWLRDGSDGIGVIAQEVEQVIPSVVVTNEVEGLDGMEEVKSVDYGKIVGVLINAINELKAEVDELKGGK